MIKGSSINDIFKKNIYFFIVIVLFIILCVSYILIIPAFEAPDEPWHFSYAFYLAKYNKMPSQYNEHVSATQYMKNNTEKNSLNVLYMDNKYMIYSDRSDRPDGSWSFNKFHHPPLYYFISSWIIKPFNVDSIYIEDNHNQEQGIYNRFTGNKILKNNSPTISLVFILRLFQIVYGVLVIIFMYKIIKLLTNNEFENKSIILLSGIAFLPQYVFLCSYINNDLLSALFGLISVYFIVLLFKRDKAYLGLMAILFAIIGGFTKYTILIMLPVAIIAFLVWLVIKKKKWALISVSAIIFLTIAAFFYFIFNIRRNPSLLLSRIIITGNEILAGFKEGKYRLINIPSLKVTFESSVAFFGWMNIAADKFIYNYFLAYIVSGVLLFFVNIKDYRKSKKSIIFLILSIISILIYFQLYSASTNWGQNQGRTILTAVFLLYILVILGFRSIKASYRNILYYGLFSCSLFISVFCLYNYIYLAYY
jgi:hypothetical protein